jgi:hypothetical protein
LTATLKLSVWPFTSPEMVKRASMPVPWKRIVMLPVGTPVIMKWPVESVVDDRLVPTMVTRIPPRGAVVAWREAVPGPEGLTTPMMVAPETAVLDVGIGLSPLQYPRARPARTSRLVAANLLA